MPQLNPGPWLLVWLSSWLIFLLTIPPVLMMFKPISTPYTNRTTDPVSPWNWPWP